MSSPLIKLPPFSSLPIDKIGPHGNAWGLWGPKDELGTLNLLTPETTRAAAAEVQHGIRISTDYALDHFTNPAFSRPKLVHEIRNKHPRCVNDDFLAFNTQVSSQWDGFRHYGYQKEMKHYNGVIPDDIMNTNRNGVNVWVENGGIIGRGVLLDYYSWAQAQSQPINALSPHAITAHDLTAVAAAQVVSFQRGDILLIRSGYMSQFSLLSPAAVDTFVAQADPPAIGVESSKEMLEWLWTRGFAAVAGDMPGLEAWPCSDKEYWLHEWLLAGWGMPIGELFDLEALAVECARLKKWSFMFCSVPLKVGGGVASPPNGVAVL